MPRAACSRSRRPRTSASSACSTARRRTLGLDLAALAPAERAGLVTVDVDRLDFCHPLARSAAYRSAPRTSAAPPTARSRAPIRTPTGRRGTPPGPRSDPTTRRAQALEDAARRARSRGAYTAAASSFERAARLTPDDAERAPPAVAAADAAWLAGHTERASSDSRRHSSSRTTRAQVRDRPAPRARGATRRPRDGRPRHPARRRPSEADPDSAVVMFAEATEACLLRARAGRDAAGRAARLGAADPDAGEPRALLRRGSRSAWR